MAEYERAYQPPGVWAKCFKKLVETQRSSHPRATAETQSSIMPLFIFMLWYCFLFWQKQDVKTFFGGNSIYRMITFNINNCQSRGQQVP